MRAHLSRNLDNAVMLVLTLGESHLLHFLLCSHDEVRNLDMARLHPIPLSIAAHWATPHSRSRRLSPRNQRTGVREGRKLLLLCIGVGGMELQYVAIHSCVVAVHLDLMMLQRWREVHLLLLLLRLLLKCLLLLLLHLLLRELVVVLLQLLLLQLLL